MAYANQEPKTTKKHKKEGCCHIPELPLDLWKEIAKMSQETWWLCVRTIRGMGLYSLRKDVQRQMKRRFATKVFCVYLKGKRKLRIFSTKNKALGYATVLGASDKTVGISSGIQRPTWVWQQKDDTIIKLKEVMLDEH